MKKVLYVILAMTLLLTALCGCGSKTDTDNTPAPDPTATPEPTPEPTPTSVDLKAFFDALPEKYELAKMMEMDEEILANFFPGLTDVDTVQLVAYTPAITSAVSEFVFVQVADKADAQKVADILNERIKTQAEGGAWYPESMEAWSKAQVVTQGSYVAMVATFEVTDQIISDFKALF